MIEIEYFFTSSKSFLEGVAKKLSQGIGETVMIKNNGLVFPPAFGKGRLECHIVNADLALILHDYAFFEEVSFFRSAIMVDYFHTLSFNISTSSFLIEKQGVETLQIGDSWEGKVFHSTSRVALKWQVPKDKPVRIITLFFTAAWLRKVYQADSISAEVPYSEDWPHTPALQSGIELDMELLLLLQDIFNTTPPRYVQELYYEGIAKRLMAMVVSRFTNEAESEIKLNYDEVSQIINAGQALEKKLDQPLPPLEVVAQECHMSKSKFEKLFKAIFGKSYTDFFNNVRMQKAAELLRAGWEVGTIAKMLGYQNIDNFTKMFKSYYKTTPKVYQAKIKEKFKN